MIYSPFTNWGAQASYDHIRESGVKNNKELRAHVFMQSVNLLAEVYPIAHLTSMGNPAMISYGYKGIDAARFGIVAAQADRLAFQRASSPAYRLGASIGQHLAWPTSARILVGNSKKAVAARAAMARGARIGGRIGFKVIPGIGWAMLAYDVYDLVANKRLLGINL